MTTSTERFPTWEQYKRQSARDYLELVMRRNQNKAAAAAMEAGMDDQTFSKMRLRYGMRARRRVNRLTQGVQA